MLGHSLTRTRGSDCDPATYLGHGVTYRRNLLWVWS
jgi:hypothetical protein